MSAYNVGVATFDQHPVPQWGVLLSQPSRQKVVLATRAQTQSVEMLSTHSYDFLVTLTLRQWPDHSSVFS